MSRTISVTLSDEDYARLEQAVDSGRFESLDAAVQVGLTNALEAPGPSDLAKAYADAYGRLPQDPALGEAGALLMAERIRAEERQAS